jgi:hypothetical protein
MLQSWQDFTFSRRRTQADSEGVSRSFQSRNFLELANQDIHRFAGVLV